jgi:hypothetical protein
MLPRSLTWASAYAAISCRAGATERGTDTSPGAHRSCSSPGMLPRWLERLPFRVVVTWAVGACALGYGFVVYATTPDGLLPAPTATLVHTFHLALGQLLELTGVAALTLARPERLPRWITIALLGVVAWAPVIFVVATAAPEQDAWLRPLAAAASVYGGAVGLAAAVALARIAGPTPRPLGLGLAALTLLGSGVALALGVAARRAFAPVTPMLLVGAVAALGEPAPGKTRGGSDLLALLLLAAATVAPGEHVAVALARIGVGGLVLLTTWRAGRDGMPSAIGRWTARVALVLFGHAMLGRAFLGLVSVDVHLHDTWFVTGVSHLEAFALLLALLAEWLRTREPRPHARQAAWLGVVATFLGAHTFGYALLRTGALGMPVGYLRYVPTFQAGHIVAALGATLLIVGLLLIVTTVRRVHPVPAAPEVFQ